jgi:hypothetical protein
MNRLIMSFSLVLVLSLGCQSKLRTEHKFSLGPGQLQDIFVDGPTHAQKAVLALSSDQPVDVVVYLKKDADAERPKNPLGSLKQSSSGTLEVQIPAKEAFVVTVSGGLKPTNCLLKITGQ